MTKRKNLDLGSAPAGRLFSAYFIPTLLGMLVESLYILVDGIFVGRGVGPLGLGAVNLVWPLLGLFIGLGIMLGGGGATLYSIRIGRGKVNGANRIFSMTIVCVAVLTGGLSLLIFWKMEAIIGFLGAEASLADFVRQYLSALAPFFMPFLLGLVLFGFLRNDGNPHLAMIATVVPSLLNVLLDYVFIFVFGWGLTGAALATGIGWCLSALLCLVHFLRKDRHLRWCSFRPRWRELLSVASLGFPPFLLESSLGVSAYMVNLALLRWSGEEGIMAFGIISPVAAQAVMAVLALNNALQPLISFNHGAGKSERVGLFLRLGAGTGLGMGLLFFVLAWTMGGYVVALFAPGEKELQSLAYRGMLIYFTSFAFCGLNLAVATWFQGMGKAAPASWIVFLRGALLVAGGLFSLPLLMGPDGVWWAVPFAEVLTLFFCAALLRGEKEAIVLPVGEGVR